MNRNVSYSEIKDSLNTGDVMLFHGLGFECQFIEALQWSEWSHVGMVINPQDIDIEYDGLLLWESSTSDYLEDITLKCKKKGPMLVSLHDRLEYDLKTKGDNKFYISYLNYALDNNMFSLLKQFINDVHNYSFPDTKQFYENFVMGREFNKTHSNKNYFCSELLADTYMHLGLITRRYVPNSYEPKDFSLSGHIPFIKRACLLGGAYIDRI